MPIIDQFFTLRLENNLRSICFTKSKTQVYPATERELSDSRFVVYLLPPRPAYSYCGHMLL